MDYSLPTTGGLGQSPQGQQMPPALMGLPPELIQQVLAQGAQAAQQGGIARQRKLADMLRGQSGNLLQGQQVGRHYVPPGALNYLAHAYMNFKAGQSDADADTRERDLASQQQAARRRYFEVLSGRRNSDDE